MLSPSSVMGPAGNSPRVRRLIAQLAPKGQLEKVALVPAADARANECVPNVDAVVGRSGGRAELGWMLWDKLPGVLLEAEFHAVWVRPDGRREDVTPKQIPGVDYIFFVPDAALVYRGEQIDNRRVALRDDRVVHDYIAAAEARFKVLNDGVRAGQQTVTLTEAEHRVLKHADVSEEQMFRRFVSGF